MSAGLRRFEQYIDGAFAPAATMLESIDPSSGRAWALVPAASAAEVDRAVSAAHRAFTDGPWPRMTATQRGAKLHRLGDLLARHAPRLAGIETRDTGKIIRETSAQIGYIAEYYRYYGGLADKMEGAHVAADKPDMDVFLRREPIGVVAAVVPWNSQMFLAAVKLGPALAAGCTVVLKASEDAPVPLLEFARLIAEAGFPPGVVNVLTGRGEACGRALTSHKLVARIAFTGGPPTAREVMRNAAGNLAHVTLELGGKSPLVVFDDADPESACNAAIAGIFAAGGQSCVAGSRLLVQRGMHDRLLDMLARRANAIRIGDPQDNATEMGPLATRRQLDHIAEVLGRSIAAGARVIAGGRQPEGFGDGFYHQPTIVACAGNDIACAREELFGPVLSVLAFGDEADAVAKANDTDYGLAAGVFTRDLARAHRMTRAIRAGVVWVNTYRTISPMVPFGGYGLSGLGREGGSDAMRDYTRTKSVWIRTSDAPLADPFVMR